MKPEYRLPFEAEQPEPGHCRWSGDDSLPALVKALAQTSERLARAEAEVQSLQCRASEAVAAGLAAKIQTRKREVEIKRLTEAVVALRAECDLLRRAEKTAKVEKDNKSAT